jgi:hypothetical protein
VTVGRQKAEHVRRYDAANQLLGYFTAKNRTDDLVIHIADPTSRERVNQVIEAANAVEPNGSIDESGQWSVRRVPVSRDAFTIYSGFDEVPEWWPRVLLRQMVLEVWLAGPESTHAPGQVRVLFGVPAIAYINPVMKKTDRPQGQEGYPFLLAVDVFGLPGAFRDLPPQIDSFLSSGAVCPASFCLWISQLWTEAHGGGGFLPILMLGRSFQNRLRACSPSKPVCPMVRPQTRWQKP